MDWTQIKDNHSFRSAGYYLWKGLSLMAMLTLGMLTVEGAQYNFHVNSVEQGANSTANPVLNVNGGKVEKKGEGNTTSLSNAPATTGVETVPVTGTLSTTHIETKRSQTHYFRFGVSALTARLSGEPDDQVTHGRPENKNIEVMGQLGFYPISYLGFNAFGGSYSRAPRHKFLLGGEVHLIPLRIDIFGMDNMLEIGIMGGIWNLTPPRSAERHWATAFAGAKVALNFGRDTFSDPRWAVNASVRANQDVATGDLGLAYKF